MKIRKLIEKVISEEGKISGDLNFILTSDKTLKKMNIEFLKHNYFTDVMSFGSVVGNTVEGEVYISAERVKINALNYKVSYYNEMLRVIIHGTLHLCGYTDESDDERSNMRLRENFWMEKFKAM